jgi:hypothetical protein
VTEELAVGRTHLEATGVEGDPQRLALVVDREADGAAREPELDATKHAAAPGVQREDRAVRHADPHGVPACRDGDGALERGRHELAMARQALEPLVHVHDVDVPVRRGRDAARRPDARGEAVLEHRGPDLWRRNEPGRRQLDRLRDRRSRRDRGLRDEDLAGDGLLGVHHRLAVRAAADHERPVLRRDPGDGQRVDAVPDSEHRRHLGSVDGTQGHPADAAGIRRAARDVDRLTDDAGLGDVERDGGHGLRVRRDRQCRDQRHPCIHKGPEGHARAVCKHRAHIHLTQRLRAAPNPAR